MNKQIWRSLMTLIDNTANFEILAKKTFQKSPVLLEKLREDAFPPSIVAFYATMNGFRLKWKFQEQLVGGVNFLPAEHLYDATKQDLHQNEVDWFIDDKPITLSGYYHPIDYITDEASVGILSAEKTGELYYYEAGAVFYSLHLGIEGYCKLLDHSYGLLRWPRLLLGLYTDMFQADVDPLLADLHTINPGFDLEKFQAEYANYQLKS